LGLGDALGKHKRAFSPVYVALVRAGEAGGVLDDILARLADSLEKQKEFTNKVKQAMVYPTVVISGMIIVSVIMIVFVVPKLTEIYEGFGTELPLATRILVAISDAMIRYWYLWTALVGLGVGLVIFWLKTATGREVFDTYLFRLPIIGRLRLHVFLTEFTRTLGLLVSAGIPIIEGLRISADSVGNFLIREEILHVADQVEKGLPLSVPFSQGEYFPPILANMVSVGEETGKVDEVLLKLSAYFEAESGQSVSVLTAAIEPLIMIVLGLGVAFLVIAIIMPIYSLNQAL
jgi:type IV pilus assembly protein PilC